jgi:hypothetical protein
LCHYLVVWDVDTRHADLWLSSIHTLSHADVIVCARAPILPILNFISNNSGISIGSLGVAIGIGIGIGINESTTKNKITDGTNNKYQCATNNVQQQEQERSVQDISMDLQDILEEIQQEAND